MKQCDICGYPFNPHQETTCKKCEHEIAMVHILEYHDAKGRIGELESRIAEFVFECSNRKVSRRWMIKEVEKFKEVMDESKIQ